MGKVKLQSLLANDRLESDLWMYKSAQQADDTQFETDFSNMAMTFLQDRAPALMGYIVGFETVDRSDDQTRAVGIFGFKIDDDFYYVPCFFLNNQVKGMESILSKRTNSFIPLTEEWVNFIINRRAMVMGKSKDEQAPEEFENPNFQFLRRPLVGPLGGDMQYKDASIKVAESDGGPEWNGGLAYFGIEKDASGNQKPWTFGDAWDIIRYRIAEGLRKDAAMIEAAVGLHDAMTGSRCIVKKSSDHSPIRAYIEYAGGPVAAKTLLRGILSSEKMANAAMTFYKDLDGFAPKKFPKGCVAVKRAQEAALLHNPEVTFTDKSNGDESAARDVLEDGFTVRDRRDDDHTSSVVGVDYESSFTNPDRSGVYDVLCVGGKSHEAYVMELDRICRHGPAGATVVYFPDNDQVIMTRNQYVIVHGDRKKSSKAIYDDADRLSSIRAGGTYLFVGPDGTCVGTFHCGSSEHEEGSRVVLHGHVDSYVSTYAMDREAGMSSGYDSGTWWVSFDSVELASFAGRPVAHGTTLVMPSNWKVLDVSEKASERFDVPEASDSDSEKEKPAPKRHELGTMASLQAEFRKQGAAELDVRSDDGTDFYLRFDGNGFTGAMPYKQASVLLVTRLGMRYPDAKSLLKSAADSGVKRVLLKMGQLVGVNPQMPPEQAAMADPYTGIPTYQSPYAAETRTPFDGVELPPPDNVQGENIDGDMSRQQQEAEFDPEAEQLAEQAAQAGQKNVFDQAAIGGLAKVYDTSAVIDSYLPEFMQSLDRLGRVLFLYYWKQDDFVQRYGVDVVVEMEELLKATFKQLGKLTLDLRKKAVSDGQ